MNLDLDLGFRAKVKRVARPYWAWRRDCTLYTNKVVDRESIWRCLLVL